MDEIPLNRDGRSGNICTGIHICTVYTYVNPEWLHRNIAFSQAKTIFAAQVAYGFDLNK